MYLTTEEVNLYYEVRGEGKPVLMIHGVVVDAGMYEAAAELLSKYYQVITFDRRGNSRSEEVFGQDYSVDAQVRDAVSLLKHLQLDQVFVVGASAGGIVTMELCRQYPKLVEHALIYEVPLVSLLQSEEEDAWIAGIEDKVARKRYNGAMFEFMISLGESDERKPAKTEEAEMREIGNFYHFLQNEFHTFLHYEPDMEAFKALSYKFTMAVGEKTGESKYVRAATLFQETIGCEMLHFPGCHNLPYDLPLDFVTCLMGVLARYRW